MRQGVEAFKLTRTDSLGFSWPSEKLATPPHRDQKDRYPSENMYLGIILRMKRGIIGFHRAPVDPTISVVR